jgi:hypothetical protein
MHFVLEESSWAWDGMNREAYIERMEQLLDRLDVARSRREVFAASSVLLAQPILGATTLADLLWDQELSLKLPHEVSERLIPHISAMAFWDDEIEWPELDVDIAGNNVLSPSTALAHARMVRGQATACFPLPGTWRGAQQVQVGGVVRSVHFVVDEASHRSFFRDAGQATPGDKAGLEALAPHAFPDLFFLDGVWDGLRLFEGGYRRVRDALHNLLAVLDDHGGWVFTDDTGRLSPQEGVPTEGKQHVPVTNQLIQRRFIGWGLDIAPEHLDVYNHHECRRARERTLGSQVLYCEWHFKLEQHINRVHIHGPIPQSNGKLIVAIFRDHLPLPGN